MMSMRGMLITVEGVEGSGKSTQCRRLAESLRARGLDVILTREPDGTPMGAAIRRLFTADAPTPTPLTQVFLFMAARQQHVAEVIRPALSRGAVVDRKSTRLNSSHPSISYAVFCLKKKRAL